MHLKTAQMHGAVSGPHWQIAHLQQFVCGGRNQGHSTWVTFVTFVTSVFMIVFPLSYSTGWWQTIFAFYRSSILMRWDISHIIIGWCLHSRNKISEKSNWFQKRPTTLFCVWKYDKNKQKKMCKVFAHKKRLQCVKPLTLCKKKNTELNISRIYL